MANKKTAIGGEVQPLKDWRNAWCGSKHVFRKRIGAAFLYVVEEVKHRRLAVSWSVRGDGYAGNGPAEDVRDGQEEALAYVRRHQAQRRRRVVQLAGRRSEVHNG